MGARFTKGDSTKTTRTLTPLHRSTEPRTHSKGPVPHETPKPRNTMNGMPGHINAHEPDDMGHAKGGSGAGPHREGYIGKETGAHHAREGGKYAPGTEVKSYRKASTGKAGSYKKTDYIGGRHVHTANRGRVGEGAAHKDKTHAVAQGKIAGAGIGHTKAPFGTGKGQHAGRMESLRGKATTSFERKGSKRSVMY